MERLRFGTVLRQKEGGEGRINYEIILIGFDKLLVALPNGGVGGFEGDEGGENRWRGKWLDFDGDCRPFREESRLKFAMV